MTTNKRGGYRIGSGSKPHPPEQVASVRIVANVTPAEAQAWQRRGRTAWLRSELRKTDQATIKTSDDAVAWRFIGAGGLKPYLTQKQYEAQTAGVQRFYEPVCKCAQACRS